MLGKIVSIKNSIVYVQLSINIYESDSLISKNITFGEQYIGEVIAASNSMLEVAIVGEIVDKRFIPGGIVMPPFGATCRLTTIDEVDIIYGVDKKNNIVKVGKSSVYDKYDVFLDINSFFSSHFSVLGNTGSGKSYFISRLLQGIFYDAKRLPFNTNILLFDTYGEYQCVFENIGKINSNLNYKVITTDLKDNRFDKLMIPFWLLSVDDICLLLEVDDMRQISIVEKALKLVSYFSREDDSVIAQKNDIIARSLMDIIFSLGNVTEIRNAIVTILTKFNTHSLNLEVGLTKGGWTRTLRQCIYVDASGRFADIELVINYLEQFCSNAFELSIPDGSYMYTINDFYDSLEFALMSEGIFSSSKVFDYANILKTRLNTLINSDYVHYFNCSRYMNRVDYIRYLLTSSNGGKCQIINFNINYVEERFAKVIVKIFSKLIFDYVIKLSTRASMPFNIILEEAHRYVQDDIDRKILGYNIFDRIVKEGRKYGMLLGLVSQRPSELSQTAVSQCSNFAVFKMFYPDDIKFVSSAISGMSDSILQRVKCLNPGGCVLFGSSFKFPILTTVDLPDPTPLSQNCDINNIWYIN